MLTTSGSHTIIRGSGPKTTNGTSNTWFRRCSHSDADSTCSGPATILSTPWRNSKGTFLTEGASRLSVCGLERSMLPRLGLVRPGRHHERKIGNSLGVEQPWEPWQKGRQDGHCFLVATSEAHDPRTQKSATSERGEFPSLSGLRCLVWIDLRRLSRILRIELSSPPTEARSGID